MTDEQFKALRTLILDQNVKIAELSLVIRSMQQRIEELAAPDLGYSEAEMTSTIHSNEQFEELLRTRQSRGPDTDS